MNRPLRKGLALLFAALVWLSSAAASAQPDDTYARYYGDGLRHYAEGDFGEAVENLFRAYALQSKPSTLGLIVTSYDQMGFCDAASRQLEVHRMVHPGAEAPRLTRCTSTGSVEIRCQGPEAKVSVDHQFEVSCGQRLTLPVGEHQLSAQRADSPKHITIAEDQTATVEFVIAPAPERWKTAASHTEVTRIPDAAARVARLEHGDTDYTVFQSNDGLYRIIIHPRQSGAGGVLSVPVRPDVLRLCDSGESFDSSASRCQPVQGMQIQKME